MKYLGLFGTIESQVFLKKHCRLLGFVQYSNPLCAATVLQKRKHFFSGFWIKVSAADSWHQPTYETQNHQLLSAHILDLNDDCLHHVFGFLNSIDLAAVHYTCRRFKCVAGYEFRVNHGSVNLTKATFPGYIQVDAPRLRLLQIRHLVSAHGSSLHRLQVAADYFQNPYRALGYIFRQCFSLNTLGLLGFDVTVNPKLFS